MCVQNVGAKRACAIRQNPHHHKVRKLRTTTEIQVSVLGARRTFSLVFSRFLLFSFDSWYFLSVALNFVRRFARSRCWQRVLRALLSIFLRFFPRSSFVFMITVLEHPLVKRDITILRDKRTSSPDFRAAMRRIGAMLAAEASKYAPLKTFPVETPLETTEGYALASDIVLLPVLRAGAGLVEPFLDVIPEAKLGYMGLRRNEHTLANEEYYFNAPVLEPSSLVLLLDPMLATGGSICSSVERIKNKGTQSIIVISVIAAPEGVKRVLEEHPGIRIITATLDRCLNDVGYILPGLGDAGDRYHGTV
jgi:uracil phosphoribosyltransferase